MLEWIAILRYCDSPLAGRTVCVVSPEGCSTVACGRVLLEL